MKVSIIVPIYNGEKYIEQCMSLLLNQTIKDIEVIAVDDNSTDNTYNCLIEWKNRDDRLKVIHLTKNIGPGGARNIGILNANGEYVGFMDCDDVIDLSMYEKLYKKAIEGNYDIVDCGYHDENNNTTVLAFNDEVVGELDNSKKNEAICGVGYAVTKIFRLSILKDESMKIRENVIYEDIDFLIHAILRSESIGNVKEVLYIYKCNGTSISKKQKEQKKFDDMMAALHAIDKLSFGEELVLSKQYAKASCMVGGIGICLLNQDNEEFRLMENLKMAKEQALFLHNWQNNYLIQKHMQKEQRELLNWFLELNL